MVKSGGHLLACPAKIYTQIPGRRLMSQCPLNDSFIGCCQILDCFEALIMAPVSSYLVYQLMDVGMCLAETLMKRAQHTEQQHRN